MKILLYLTTVFVVLNAQALEVTQLFNKKIVKVERENINLTKTFYGDIVIPDNAIKDLNIRFDGYIQNVYTNKNYTLVKKGDKLFDIYSDEINLVMNELLLRDKRLRKSYLEKFKSYNIDKKVLTKLLSTNKVQEYIPIYSPYEGFLITKDINDGSFAKKGKRLLQIADFKKLWVLAKVYQSDLPSIKNNMKVKVNIDGIGIIDSKIDFIYPNVNTKDKTISVRVEIPNQDLKIFPNMFAKVMINTLQKSMLVLPKTAVLTKADKHFVFIPNGEEFEPKEVTAKRINSNQFEIIGLNENDIVIDKAAFLLDSDAITNGLYESSDDDDDW